MNEELKNNHNQNCVCKSSQGLFVENRTLSLMVAFLLVLSGALFVGGYFLGQRSTVTLFTHTLEQASFGDQIYSSLCALCDSESEVEESSENEETGEEEGEDQTAMVETPEAPASEVATANNQEHVVIPYMIPNVLVKKDNENALEADELQEYCAQLAGFGTVRAAQQFARKLSKKEIPVLVKKRQSRSARGRFVVWYQVVTEKFTDKPALEALVKRLEYEEKLNDVHIVTC